MSQTFAQKLVHAVAGTAVLFAMGGCANHGPKTESQVDAISAREMTPAELEFESGASRPPTAKTLFSFARMLSSQGRDTDAATLLRKIIAEYPSFMPAYCELAENQMRHRQIEEADRTLAAGLKLKPQDAILLNDRGMCHTLLHDYDAALQEFTSAAAVVPDNPRYRANMATALGMLGRYEESMSLYLQIMPLADAKHNLATLRRARGDQEQATALQSAPAARATPKPAPNPQPLKVEPKTETPVVQAAAPVSTVLASTSAGFENESAADVLPEEQVGCDFSETESSDATVISEQSQDTDAALASDVVEPSPATVDELSKSDAGQDAGSSPINPDQTQPPGEAI